MRWQKILRIAIALFVVAFATVVGVSLRRGRRPAQVAAALEMKKDAPVMQTGQGHFIQYKQGKDAVRIDFGNQATYADNRSTFGGGVKVLIPDKEGRRIEIV